MFSTSYENFPPFSSNLITPYFVRIVVGLKFDCRRYWNSPGQTEFWQPSRRCCKPWLFSTFAKTKFAISALKIIYCLQKIMIIITKNTEGVSSGQVLWDRCLDKGNTNRNMLEMRSLYSCHIDVLSCFPFQFICSQQLKRLVSMQKIMEYLQNSSPFSEQCYMYAIMFD